MTGFTRAFASGVLLLLAISSTKLVPLVDGASSSADDVAVACGTELIACQDDPTCVTGCLQDGDLDTDTQECFEALGFVSSTSSTSATCDDAVSSACCLDSASEDDCLENDAFVDYWLCVVGTLGCSNDEIDCNGAMSYTDLGTSSTAAVVSVTCVFMLLLQLVWT